MDRVGVRELRQNLSVYLRRVKDGESLEVTEQGATLVRVVPATTGSPVLDRLIAEGRARPAPGRLADLPPPEPPQPGEISISEALQEQREERI